MALPAAPLAGVVVLLTGYQATAKERLVKTATRLGARVADAVSAAAPPTVCVARGVTTAKYRVSEGGRGGEGEGRRWRRRAIGGRRGEGGRGGDRARADPRKKKNDDDPSLRRK
jgi:hypothetical protein